MANVLFKRGTQDNLTTLLSNKSVIDGCFYLTTDSHRLYVGQDDAIVPVNEGVTTVSTLAALNNLLPKKNDADYEKKRVLLTGSFFYVEESNILCVYNGTECVQINPDTNTDTRIDKVTTLVTGDKDKITVTLQLQQKSYDPISNSPLAEQPANLLDPIDLSFEIDAEKFNALVQEVTVGLQASVDSTSKVTISTKGVGSDATSAIKLVAGDAISFENVADDATAIKIVSQDTTYDISAGTDNGKAVLKLNSSDSGAQTDKVEFAAGEDLTVTASNDVITYSHAEYDDVSIDVSSQRDELAHEGTFKIISKVESVNGHLINVETQDLTLPEDTYIDDITLENGIITFKYSTGKTDEIINTIGDYKNGGTWYVGDTLDVYTTEEIDDKFAEVKRNCNALHYKGVALDTLPSANVAIGDTYMVGKADLEGYECAVGDLIIATARAGASENDNGYLNAADIIWEIVPSGNDLDTKYDLTVDNTSDGAKIRLKNVTTPSDSDDVIDFIDDGVIEISAEADANHKNQKIYVSHREYDAPAETKADSKELLPQGTFTAVTGVTSDDYGHLTGYETTQFELPLDSQFQIKVEDNNGTADLVLFSSNNEGLTADEITFESSDSSLVINGNGDSIDIRHADMEANDNGTSADDKELTSQDTFTVITGVTLDNGHLVDFEKTKFTLPAADKYTYGGTVAKAASANKVTVTSTLTDTAGGKQSFAHEITSSSLELSATGNSIAVEMVWGTF